MTDSILRLTGKVDIQAAGSGEKRQPRVSILAYAGGEIVPSSCGRHVIDLARADVSGDIPLLADHDDTLDGVVGQGQATIRNNQICVEGTLTDATIAGQKVLALAKAGIALQASVGYEIEQREFVQPGDVVRANGKSFTASNSGLTIIRAGKLREVSLLPIGADSNTQVTIAAKRGTSSKGKMSMSKTTTTEHADVQAEQARVGMIQAAFDGCQLSDHMRDRAELLLNEAILERQTPEQFSDGLLQLVRASRPTGPAIHGGRPTPSARVLEAALLQHMGHDDIGETNLGATAMQQARELRCNSLMDIFKASLQLEGREVPATRDGMIRAGFSTVSLPGILSNAAGKIMENAYTAFPSVARLVARKLSANDFKTHTGYRITGDAQFEEVGKDGEIKHGTLSESSFSYKVSTFGKMFGITRQDVINDDLSAFDEVPKILGRGSALKLESLFWTLVLANTGAFFHDDNGNYIDGAGSALSITALSAAVEAMRKLVDANGDPISVTPKFLVVPPELEATADQLYASTNLVYGGDTAVPDSNPYKGKYQPQVTPYLSNANYAGYSAAAWYLFGDPSDVAAFGIAYLNGQETPIIEQVEQEPNVLGIGWRGYSDFGVCQVDTNGAVKAKGTT